MIYLKRQPARSNLCLTVVLELSGLSLYLIVVQELRERREAEAVGANGGKRPGGGGGMQGDAGKAAGRHQPPRR